MNARLVHISFARSAENPIDLLQVRAVVEAYALDWMSYANSAYVISTQMELAAWTNLFRQIPNMEQGYFFIVPIDPSAPVEGWLPKWAWDWIFKYRPHTPLPAPVPTPPAQDQFDWTKMLGLGGGDPK